MDILSHGFWGGVAFGRKNKKSFWLSFLFGIAPDLLSFGVFFVAVFLGLAPKPEFRMEPPQDDLIPGYIHGLYGITHSLPVFIILFVLVCIFLKKPLWEMGAWGLHILFDIPTHSQQFFPTPFLWPLSDLAANGIPWSRPIIFIPNVTLLALLYLWFFVLRPYVRRKRAGPQDSTFPKRGS